MNDSFKIATAFGIPIRIHWTFPLILLVFSGSAGIAAALLLFGCVLLHELGHSLVARRFGIRVVDITFWPLGGMARMSEIPESPRVEGWIAIAGPAVNFVLAGAGLALLGLAVAVAGPGTTVANVALFFVWINLGMGIFNLVPAFPMDGGRLLRAWFGRKLDWVVATERAVRVGRLIAGGFLFLTLWSWIALRESSLCALPFIAAFVWFAGARELMGVRLRHGLPPFGAARAAGASGPFFSFAPFARGARGARRSGGGGRAAQAEWRAATETSSEPTWTADVPPGSAQRPVAWEPARAVRGFDEETIRALESFRGPLRREPRED